MFCKFARRIKKSETHIRCMRDGSIRNINKKPCSNECAYAEQIYSLWEKLKKRWGK